MGFAAPRGGEHGLEGTEAEVVVGLRGELVGASLDHTLWFHQEAKADEWLLYATDSPWSGAGRGFNRGRIFNQQGILIASVAQEGMVRKRIKKPRQ